MKSTSNGQGRGFSRTPAELCAPKEVARTRGRGKKKSLMAILAAGLTIGLIAPQSAFADTGGGGAAPGNGGGMVGNVSVSYMMFDIFTLEGTPVQGYGMASMQWFFDNSGYPTPIVQPNAQTRMVSACTDALARAEARRAPGTPEGSSRVVGMYWAGSASNRWGDGGVNRNAFSTLYEEWVADGRPGVLSGLPNQDSYNGVIEAGFWEAWDDIGPWPNPAGALCIALAAGEPAMHYDLEVTTDTQTFDQAGSTAGIRDTIHTVSDPSAITEDVVAQVTLNWDGVDGDSRSVTKDALIPNQGSTLSPEFTPADFGWAAWPAGQFWFDVQVEEQGMMRPGSAVDTPDRDPRETFVVEHAGVTKVLTLGGRELEDQERMSSGMFYEARITANTNGYESMRLYDEILDDRVFIGATDHDVVDSPYVLDPNGNRVEDAFVAVTRWPGRVLITGQVTSIPDEFQGLTYTLVVPTYMQPTKTDYTVEDNSWACYADASMANPEDCLQGGSESIRKVTPAPDKVWVLDEDGALTAVDPDWTNEQDQDGKVFLPADAVAAVVNGKIHANLADNLTNYQLIDDWTKAADYVDFSDASQARVFWETEPGSGVFTNITPMFDIVVDGSVTTATAKAEFLALTAGQTGDRATKLVISGAFRDDYDTDGELVELFNNGFEVWNNERIETNEPPVFTWTPDPNKQVLGSADESGDKAHDDIDGLAVFPGQKLEYSIGVDLRVPGNTARGVKSLAVQDVYDPMFEPDRSSVEFWDSRNPLNPRPVLRSAYELVFDDATHSFTATFTDEWIAENVNVEGANSDWLTDGWLTVRFTGTVKDTAERGSTVVNQAFQIINGVKVATEIPEVVIPPVETDKEDLNTDLVDIDGKTVLEGDIILYRLTLDARPSRDQIAYNVHKLGMIDDFDEEYLDLSVDGVSIINQETAEDVTDRFNIQIIDGVLYAFAKQVDYTNAYGDVIAGEPQPANLAEYDMAAIDAHTTPIIDQSLLGYKYWVILDTRVKKTTDGYVIENQAVQNIENTRVETRIVSNPLKAIDPSKDVVVSAETGDNSINEAEVELNSTFNYRLNSSTIPANRAYNASNWSLTDTFDRTHDLYTGTWAVYAATDLYDGETLVAEKGQLLNDNAGAPSEALQGLFDVVFDEASYTITVTATEKYLGLVNSRGDLEQAFSVYTQMIRIAPGERIENKTIETYNSVDRESNVVWTSTPETPAISIVKFTLDEGAEAGDRDTSEEAYEITAEQFESMRAEDAEANAEAGVRVGFIVTNTGDVPLVNVAISDATIERTKGSVHGLSCEVSLTDAEKEALGEGAPETRLVAGADVLTTLAVGESFECIGRLLGLAAGELHGDNAIAAGESVYSGTKVTAEDPWFAKAPAPLEEGTPGAVTGEGIVTGVNPWHLGGGLGSLLLAAAFGATLLPRRPNAGAAVLTESNGSGSIE